ncbi:MAG: hypothetical protein ABEJ31_11440 [Haloarculaceae archaeon]
MTEACTYCGQDLADYDPVFVAELVAELVDGERRQVGQFCNYACLTAYVDSEGLETGAACRFDPDAAPDLLN